MNDDGSRYKPLRAPPVPVDNSRPSNSLFPPYHPERTSSLPQSVAPEANQRSSSPQSSHQASSSTSARSVEKGKGAGVVETKRGSVWQRFTRFILVVLPRGWTLEYVSCFISIAAFMSLVIVLSQFDQKPMPSWPLGITLNTLLALLAAISQACFVYPVVQGLSQMKWNWFSSKERPLVDFESFDGASRGAWGSILLVFRTKGRLSVLLAAVILVTSAVTSTITQAALNQNTRYVQTNGSAKAQRALNDADVVFSNAAMAIMMNAMYTSPNTTYDYDTPECSTGNCDWPTFGSLAVCSETNNITDKLQTMTAQNDPCCYYQNQTAANRMDDGWDWGPLICRNCTYATLPNGFYLDYNPRGNLVNSTNIWLSGTYPVWSDVYSFNNKSFAKNALNAVQIIYIDSSDENPYYDSKDLANATVFIQHTRAAEILFYLCAQSYDVSTANGTAVTTVNTTINYVNGTSTAIIESDGQYSTYQNYSFILGGQNYSYYDIFNPLGDMFSQFAYGPYNYFVPDGIMENMTPFSYAVGDVLFHNTNIDTNSSTERDEQMFQALSVMHGNMAKGVTNWLRSQGSTVQGQANELSVYVVVRWNYLIFLGVQVLLSAAFLVWIVVDSRRRKMEVLKESALASLLAIPGGDREYLERQLSMTEDGKEGMEQRQNIERTSRARLIQGNESGEWDLRVVPN